MADIGRYSVTVSSYGLCCCNELHGERNQPNSFLSVFSKQHTCFGAREPLSKMILESSYHHTLLPTLNRALERVTLLAIPVTSVVSFLAWGVDVSTVVTDVNCASAAPSPTGFGDTKVYVQ